VSAPLPTAAVTKLAAIETAAKDAAALVRTLTAAIADLQEQMIA
jgi:hypothetical protein